MPYVCMKCENEVDLNPVEDKIICPYCSSRGVFKTRSEEATSVKAR